MSVGQLVNQNSYAISAAIVLIVITAQVVRGDVTVRAIGLLALAAVALAVPVMLLRSPQYAAATIEAAIGSGKPVLLEVYSDL